MAYAAGITLAVVAWGYLVYLAIDFGTAARGGQGSGWALLGLAAVGAMACLFAGLMLGARLLVELGITSAPPPSKSAEPTGGVPTPPAAPGSGTTPTPPTAAPPTSPGTHPGPEGPPPAPRPPGGRRRR